MVGEKPAMSQPLAAVASRLPDCEEMELCQAGRLRLFELIGLNRLLVYYKDVTSVFECWHSGCSLLAMSFEIPRIRQFAVSSRIGGLALLRTFPDEDAIQSPDTPNQRINCG